MKNLHRSIRAALIGTMLLGLVLVAGCASCEDEAGTGANNGGVNNGGETTGDMTFQKDSVFEQNEGGQVLCDDGEPCECDNGKDDDGDGLVDGFDPECTGPYDDVEDSFETGIPGDNVDPKWQDCFFDGNSGSGDDGCRYHTDCLTGDLPASDPDCQVSQQCLDFCRPRTPNGCDCFGCCEIFLDDGTSTNVVINSECSTDNIEQCQTCVPSDSCGNQCGECELCLGKTADELPDTCGGGTTTGDMGTTDDMGGGGDTGGGGPSYTCDDGETVCESSHDCPENFYCQQGCCIEILL